MAAYFPPDDGDTDTRISDDIHHARAVIFPAGLEYEDENGHSIEDDEEGDHDHELIALKVMDMHVLRNKIIELRALAFQLDKLLQLGVEDFRAVPREQVLAGLEKLAEELEDSPELQEQWGKVILKDLDDDYDENDESKVKQMKEACKEDLKLLIKTARDGVLERLLEHNVDPTSGNVKEFKMEVEKLIQSKMNLLTAVACKT